MPPSPTPRPNLTTFKDDPSQSLCDYEEDHVFKAPTSTPSSSTSRALSSGARPPTRVSTSPIRYLISKEELSRFSEMDPEIAPDGDLRDTEAPSPTPSTTWRRPRSSCCFRRFGGRNASCFDMSEIELLRLGQKRRFCSHGDGWIECFLVAI
jgi:hypothetical protein